MHLEVNLGFMKRKHRNDVDTSTSSQGKPVEDRARWLQALGLMARTRLSVTPWRIEAEGPVAVAVVATLLAVTLWLKSL